MKSRKVAFGAVVSALSLTLMLMTAVLPVGTYALPCMAGLLLMLIVIEFSPFWAIGVYIAVSVLSALIVPDKEAVLYYVLMLGIYPVLKSFFERIRLKWLSFVLKFIFFNLMAVAAFFASIYVLSVPLESFSLFGVNMPLVFLLMGNVVFFVYDICISRLANIYLNVWRHRFKL